MTNQDALDAIKEMAADMELISDFLKENGRFVGSDVHVRIKHLADCIRSAMPNAPSGDDVSVLIEPSNADMNVLYVGEK